MFEHAFDICTDRDHLHRISQEIADHAHAASQRQFYKDGDIGPRSLGGNGVLIDHGLFARLQYSAHRARQKAPDGFSERALYWPDHGASGTVGLCNHRIVRHLDPFSFQANAVVAVS